MNTIFYKKRIINVTAFTFFYFLSFTLSAQNNKTSTAVSKENSTVIIAGKQYNRSRFHQWLWGQHYRKEWAMPVTVPLLQLDTAAGGLTPYEAGGGRQSKSLKLHDKSKREYV
ncbi:MAG TPA: hypothetical protein VM888_07625, partial [Chitinophagaceae bacterium]|nr:hypothetical protein [Chitinophagaceae bacterium]